jgi:hypothetical protein
LLVVRQRHSSALARTHRLLIMGHSTKKIEVEVGSRFHRLVVLKEVDRLSGVPRRRFLCRCDCGELLAAPLDSLRTGNTKSCGCLKMDKILARSTSHGLRHHPAYHSWNAMMGRCFNPKNRGYRRYGGRGITVCERWRDVRLFIADMGESHSPGLTLEREDVDGNYGPGNVIWATQKVQNRNIHRRRDNTSGRSGVLKSRGARGSHYWLARWIASDGTKYQRSFSILKYGNDEAYRRACEVRDAQFKQHGYSDKHGK